MAALIDALARTVHLIMEIAISGAEAAFEKVKPAARVYLRSLIITTLVGLLLIPFMVILKAVTGLSVFGYLAAFFAIIFATILGLLYAPLGLVIGMLAGKTANPAEAGERYLRFIGSVVFTVLMASLYLARVPLERNAEALPVLVIAAAAVIIGNYIWGGWLSGRFYTFVAIVIMSLTTLSFFWPKFFETMSQKFHDLDTNMAEFAGYREPDPIIDYGKTRRATNTAQNPIDTSTISAPENPTSVSSARERPARPKVISVQIPTNNQLSDYIKIPTGWYFRIKRPGNIELEFDNGTVVKAVKGQPLDIGHPPSWGFRLRGYPGEAVITISPNKL